MRCGQEPLRLETKKKDGDRLIYTTRPAPFVGDGEMSVQTLVWEKVR
jgi:hypothetical protein